MTDREVADKGAYALAERLRSIDPDRADQMIRKRLMSKPHKSRLKVELDFNARLLTALRETGVWPPKTRRG